jgi:hypothetical protein
MKTKNIDIDKIIANASATLAVEGLKPSKTALSISRSYLHGEISSREAVAKIKAKYIKTKN